MMKKFEKVNYVVVGSRYQVINPETGEPVPEWGVGVFRNGVRLDVAREIYVTMVTKRELVEDEVTAKGIAADAFKLAEIFTEEMDRHFQMPPPPKPKLNNSRP